MKKLKFLVDKANEIYPIKEKERASSDVFFDPDGSDAKQHNKVLVQAMHWAFQLGMKATVAIIKENNK